MKKIKENVKYIDINHKKKIYELNINLIKMFKLIIL